MTNIAEILKYCPKGTKLYSPTCGDCILKGVDSDSTYPISVTSCSDAYHLLTFTNEGKLLARLNGECLLFPSKDQRDWDEFRIPAKRGDIMMLKDKSAVFIVKEYTDDFTKTIVEASDAFGTRVDTRIFTGYIPASEGIKKKLFEAINRKGYKWNGEDLVKLVKKEHQFKPFDKVLVRDTVLEKWRATLFSHYSGSRAYPYDTIKTYYRQCIPFEGNEYLVGTSNSPK